MRLLKSGWLVFLMLVCGYSKAQLTDSLTLTKLKTKFRPTDTLRYYVNKQNGRFLLGLDGRNSYINGTSAPVVGIRYGLGYDKIALYTGFYSSDYFSKSSVDTVSVNYGFIASTVEYYIKDEWRYDIYVPVSIGFGTKSDSRYDVLAKRRTSVEERFIPMEVGVGGSVRFLRYLGLTGSLGYRWSLFQGSGYSAPFWSLGFTVYTGTMWRDTKKAYHKITE